MTVSQVRQPKGAPGSTGGQFALRSRNGASGCLSEVDELAEARTVLSDRKLWTATALGDLERVRNTVGHTDGQLTTAHRKFLKAREAEYEASVAVTRLATVIRSERESANLPANIAFQDVKARLLAVSEGVSEADAADHVAKFLSANGLSNYLEKVQVHALVQAVRGK